MTTERGPVDEHVLRGVADAPYVLGLLSLRIGPLMERAVRGLRSRVDLVTALEVVVACARHRMREPLRRARQLARQARDA